MLRSLNPAPRRILMTLDAVGGVWRYAVDLAHGLAKAGCATLFVGQGPPPSSAQIGEIDAVPGSRRVWLETPLDWMASGPQDVVTLPRLLATLAVGWNVELMHLNLPSQAAGLQAPCPVVVASHSCLSTWWAAVKGGEITADLAWQHDLTRQGFDAADLVLAPSRSHTDALATVYGEIAGLEVVPNGIRSSFPPNSALARRPYVIAAGRWWDEGKNARVLDDAAGAFDWPVLMAGACRGPMGQGIELYAARSLGSVSHREVQSLLAEAAMFASPSLYEPFGLAALEAAAAGTPLVLSDIATYRELWEGAAAFFPPKDAGALVHTLRRLAGDAAEREHLGRAAYERAGRLTLDAQLAALLPLYARVGAARSSLSQNRTG